MDKDPNLVVRGQALPIEMAVQIGQAIRGRLVDGRVHLEGLDAKVQQPAQSGAGRQTDLLDRDDRDLGNVDASGQGDRRNVLGAHGVGELGLGELQHDLGMHDLGDDAAVAWHAGALAQVTGTLFRHGVVRALVLCRRIGAVVVGRARGAVGEPD